jgi:VanZ family protein
MIYCALCSRQALDRMIWVTDRRSIRATVLTVVALLYWSAMFVGTHLPPATGGSPYTSSLPLDKAAHLAAFAGLAVLLCAAGAAQGVRERTLFTAVIVSIAIYGVIDEWTQGWVPGRQRDFRDWLANMLGAGLGIAAFSLIHGLFRRIKH